MEGNYSLSDLAAVTGGEGFGGNSGLLILIVLFLLFGGGLYGNRQGDYSQFATAASQNEILSGQHFDRISQQINAIGDGISSLGYSQLQQMNANTAAINGNITAEGRALQMQLSGLAAQVDNQTCAITTAIHGEGEATRALIAAQETQRLRDELNMARGALSNQAQSQYILGQLGTYYANPPCYSTTPTCGCC